MAKTAYEKALDKQRKEQKKLADKQAIQERAAAVVSGRPMQGTMRIMDGSSEELLKIILNLRNDADSRVVDGSHNELPDEYRSSLSFEFEKLTMYGMITSHYITLGGWQVTLAPDGLSYFTDKESALDLLSLSEQHTHQKDYDGFISHANKDKSDYVDSLYMTLRKLGIRIFYDSEILSWGDNWKDVLLEGTASSEFAIIVISENFFDREWTERELSEFLQRQHENGQKIVLPLLHNISLNDLKSKYPELGDIQAIDTSRFSIEEVAILFAKELIKRLR